MRRPTSVLTSVQPGTERMLRGPMNSLSSPLQAVIDVFSGPLQGVRFADIDGEGLSSLASDVESLSSEAEALEAQLNGLREALAQRQETLLLLAQQALAYARIYAESDEALSAELNEIALPRATKLRKGASTKSSERGAKATKDDLESGVEQGADVEAEAVQATTLPKSKRKPVAASAATKAQPVAAEPEAEVAPAKGARRKIPVRSGRAR